MSLKEKIESDGVVLVKNVLTPAEIDTLRASVRQRLTSSWVESGCGKGLTNCAATCDSLGWLFAHPNIIAALKQAFGEEICFTGNCDIHQNRLGNWHKDLGFKLGNEHKDLSFFGDNPFDSDENRIYKVSVYLQDQEEPYRGLQYRRGSHRFKNLKAGERCSITSCAGDIVIFDLRVTHSGMLPSVIERLIWWVSKLFSSAKKQAPAGRILKDIYWKVFGIKPREAIYFTFGPRNASTDRFAENIVMTQHGSLSSEAHLSPSLIAELAKQGVSVSPCIDFVSSKKAQSE